MQSSAARSNDKPNKSSLGKIILVVVVAVIAVVLYLTCGGGDKSTDARGARAIPIVAVKAAIGDMPVVINALGTVTPTDVVTVKTRVNGHLQSVAFREGQMVRQGDLLAEIDPRPYEVQLMQAEGEMSKNRVAHQHAVSELERHRTLFSEGVNSKQALDTQAAQVDQLAATLKSNEGAVESAKLNLTYCRITAPISGRAGLRYVDPGNLVNASDPNGIVVITALSPIHVSFSIQQDSINQVISKDFTRLSVEAWDRDSTTKLATGRLLAIDNLVDTSTGTVRLKAVYDNQDSSLFPNQFVNIRLYVDKLEKVILTPSAAIQRGPQGTFVYVVKDDSTVELRLVDIMATQGDLTALSAGIEAGETIVTEGIERLRPGARVTIPGAESSQGGGEPGESGGGQRQGRAGS